MTTGPEPIATRTPAKDKTTPETVGAKDLADAVGQPAALVRRQLRKLGIAKVESTYQWKPGSKEYKEVLKKVQDAFAPQPAIN